MVWGVGGEGNRPLLRRITQNVNELVKTYRYIAEIIRYGFGRVR